MEGLKEFKNKHFGETCFIIGTGPSLKHEDLFKIRDLGFITFAPNRIYEICDSTGWQPTYYICQDHNIIRAFHDKIKMIKSKFSFLPINHKDLFASPKMKYFVLRERDYYPGLPKFSKDVPKRLDQGYTVTYGAIQMAAYMGFKTIILLGIDHNYSVYRDAKGRPVRQSNRDSDYTAGMTHYMTKDTFPRIEESTRAYEKAEKISKKLGVKIYNATRGGKLEAFERIDIDEFYKSHESK